MTTAPHYEHSTPVTVTYEFYTLTSLYQQIPDFKYNDTVRYRILLHIEKENTSQNMKRISRIKVSNTRQSNQTEARLLLVFFALATTRDGC